MTTILISGWNDGFQKINFTMLMKSEMGLALSPAKQITDRIMDNDQVELQVPDAQVDHLLAEMAKLGARCGVVVPQL